MNDDGGAGGGEKSKASAGTEEISGPVGALDSSGGGLVWMPASWTADVGRSADNVADSGGGTGAGSDTKACGCRCSAASKTSVQCPQRTQPSEMRSWSGTTLNMVSQAGQRVIKLMREGL